MAKDAKTKMKILMNRKYSAVGKFLIILSVYALIWGTVCLFGLIFGNPDITFIVSMIILSYIVGALLMFFGIRSLKSAKQILSVFNFVDCGEGSIDKIAASVQIPYIKVTQIIEKLIKDGFLKDIYINVASGQVEGRNNSSYKPVNNITCPNCHATTSDKNGVCEFCGASLK